MTIRNIEDGLKARLRIRAATHGNSMEEEAREILREALSIESPRSPNLAQAIRRRIERFHGVELPTAPREPIREPMDFDR